MTVSMPLRHGEHTTPPSRNESATLPSGGPAGRARPQPTHVSRLGRSPGEREGFQQMRRTHGRHLRGLDAAEAGERGAR